MIVTRFAPSPAGRLHLGHVFAARVAHSLARAAGGIFLLRHEDIDGPRVREESSTRSVVLCFPYFLILFQNLQILLAASDAVCHAAHVSTVPHRQTLGEPIVPHGRMRRSIAGSSTLPPSLVARFSSQLTYEIRPRRSWLKQSRTSQWTNALRVVLFAPAHQGARGVPKVFWIWLGRAWPFAIKVASARRWPAESSTECEK